jgi:hypothetical protein
MYMLLPIKSILVHQLAEAPKLSTIIWQESMRTGPNGKRAPTILSRLGRKKSDAKMCLVDKNMDFFTYGLVCQNQRGYNNFHWAPEKKH